MPMGKWATVAEAARHYGISRQSVHKVIRKGGFPDSRRVVMPRGPVWLLPYPFRRVTLPNGRPRKNQEERANANIND